ncbi:OprD family outer membrane porin [Candidatus Pseudomonas adelgestsugas]|uniref:Porin-like protein NicP n=1 Tax=Candidatus Pseudomonas adelgestsugas TaxID=1302376 RepID=A0ABX5R710_9PSED|nr:OprD family outer membrane porin [Candidatus Pseudomonas adelgestsugas]QAX81432.1 Porin-like protein NicP precursor [Candidatus Pseudomonas adelgestsugas]
MNKLIFIAAITFAVIAQQVNSAEFIEDSQATLSLRNFYINTNNYNSSLTLNSHSKNFEWGQGLDLRFMSGFTQGTLQFGIDAIGLYGLRLNSSHINYGSTKSRSTVFPSNGNQAVNDFSSLGVTGKIKISKTVAKIGTLQPNNPVIKINDGRLLPQTFQGSEIMSNEITNLTLTAGQIESVKGRNSSNNENLSVISVNKNLHYNTAKFSNKFYYAGAYYKITKDLTASYYFGELKKFYSQNFLGVVHNLAIGSGVLKSDLRYYRSRDNGAYTNTVNCYTSCYYTDGAKPVTNSKVDNDLYSYLGVYSMSGHTFGGGYQYINGSSDFMWLNQGDGSSNSTTTDMQIQKFASAGERTWQVRYAYDFAKVGVHGMTASIVYLKGTSIQMLAGNKSEWERDIIITYVIPNGPLKNFGVAWKNAMWHSGVAGHTQGENRVTASYSVPLF